MGRQLRNKIEALSPPPKLWDMDWYEPSSVSFAWLSRNIKFKNYMCVYICIYFIHIYSYITSCVFMSVCLLCLLETTGSPQVLFSICFQCISDPWCQNVKAEQQFIVLKPWTSSSGDVNSYSKSLFPSHSLLPFLSSDRDQCTKAGICPSIPWAQ